MADVSQALIYQCQNDIYAYLIDMSIFSFFVYLGNIACCRGSLRLVFGVIKTVYRYLVYLLFLSVNTNILF